MWKEAHGGENVAEALEIDLIMTIPLIDKIDTSQLSVMKLV